MMGWPDESITCIDKRSTVRGWLGVPFRVTAVACGEGSVRLQLSERGGLFLLPRMLPGSSLRPRGLALPGRGAGG